MSTTVIVGAVIVGAVILFGRSVAILTGLAFWVAAAAGAGALAGYLFWHQAIIGAVVGAVLAVWFLGSAAVNASRATIAATANDVARMRFQAQLNAEAMAAVAAARSAS